VPALLLAADDVNRLVAVAACFTSHGPGPGQTPCDRSSRCLRDISAAADTRHGPQRPHPEFSHLRLPISSASTAEVIRAPIRRSELTGSRSDRGVAAPRATRGRSGGRTERRARTPPPNVGFRLAASRTRTARRAAMAAGEHHVTPGGTSRRSLGWCSAASRGLALDLTAGLGSVQLSQRVGAEHRDAAGGGQGLVATRRR
jgi:hypothetical protein